MSDDKPTPEEEVEKAKELVGALIANWVWARLKLVALPVLVSVLATQGGAALLVPEQVQAAVAAAVNPAKVKASTLEKGTTEAYHALALTVNRQSELLNGKASQAEVDQLYEVISSLQDQLEEQEVMLDALQQATRQRYGNAAFQRILDGVEVEAKAPPTKKAATKQAVPAVPEDFKAFLKGKETTDVIGNPHDRQN